MCTIQDSHPLLQYNYLPLTLITALTTATLCHLKASHSQTCIKLDNTMCQQFSENIHCRTLYFTNCLKASCAQIWTILGTGVHLMYRINCDSFLCKQFRGFNSQKCRFFHAFAHKHYMDEFITHLVLWVVSLT